MWKWIYMMIHPCRHKWQVLHTIRVYEFDSSQKPCEYKFVLKCAKCGDLKKKVV